MTISNEDKTIVNFGHKTKKKAPITATLLESQITTIMWFALNAK